MASPRPEQDQPSTPVLGLEDDAAAASTSTATATATSTALPSSPFNTGLLTPAETVTTPPRAGASTTATMSAESSTPSPSTGASSSSSPPRRHRAPSPTPVSSRRVFTMPARTDEFLEELAASQADADGDGDPTTSRARRPKIRAYEDEGARAASYPRISRPVELMRISYECVVIGSGYGGAVAASRLARAGKAVCLLELGAERWPGEYPVGVAEAFKELHCSGDLGPGGQFPSLKVDEGKPTGMYHLIFGKGQNAVVCNGLGGTSLMNANVFLRADPGTMGMQAWPSLLRKPGVLDPYYDKVEAVLEPEAYPADWPTLPKLNLLERQAEELGMKDKFRRVKQTTRFRNGPNSCGVEMLPSMMTGQDCTGVNDGSKTTTLVTYLADAWNWGAEMFCECEVRHVVKLPASDRRGGYLIYFAWHGRNRGAFKANLHGDLMWVHAKEAVFLGAGAIGTTEILLRSKAQGLPLSDQVGQNMSGNGDILAFGYNTDHRTNAIGRSYPSPYDPIGPCITGIIDNRTGHTNPLDGFVIQEGTVPAALARFLQVMVDLSPDEIEPKNRSLWQRSQAALARWGSRIYPYARRGALEKTQVYLIMSHDSNQAVLSLEDDKPVLEFLGVGRSNHVSELNQVLLKATEAVGGTLVNNPFFSLLGQQVTVHPIGGACMANTGEAGATDHAGRLFTGAGKEVYPGLVVVDGAVIPTALGANPLATIAALAERSMEHYATEHELEIKTDKNGILDLFGEPRHAIDWNRLESERSRGDEHNEMDSASIHRAYRAIERAKVMKQSGFGFTEVMSGFLHADPKVKEDHRETYNLASQTAERLCESARFFLSVQSFDTKSIINDPEHRAMLTGTFVCPTIPGSPFMVQRGQFNLFIMDYKSPGTKNLTYDFDMTGINGDKLHFHGYKVVDAAVTLAPFHLWKATSTLYVTVTKKLPRNLEDPDCERDEQWRHEPVVAKGIMTIKLADFMSEMLTMTPTGASLFKKVTSATSFLTFFSRKSLSLLLAPFTRLQYPTQTYNSYINDTHPTRVWCDIKAADGVFTRLYMWEPTYQPRVRPGSDERVPVRDLFMIPGASVDHQIFALPTIAFNAVNYFCRAGYRVWVTVHRIGQLMVAENHWTTYDARLDIKAALAKVRAEAFPDVPEAKKPKIYTIAHCMGSVAFSTGLLDGTIPADWILGVTCSQVFMNPVWNTLNMIKAMEWPVPLDKAYKLLAGTWFSCSTSTKDALVQRALNQALRFLPDSRHEICNSAACHRTSLVFGRCWNHRNLNEATHRQIDRFFGGVNMTLLHLLMRQGSAGHVMDNAETPLVTPDNVARLRGVPFLLFVGRDNAVLSPAATEKTYEILLDRFATDKSAGADGDGDGDGPAMYRRRVVPGYGHLDCWMGRNAWKDVYPFVRAEVDRWVRGEAFRFEEPSAREDRFTRMMEDGDLLY